MSESTQTIVLSLVLFSLLFQSFIPRGYMPGKLGEDSSFLVICGANYSLSFNELAGIDTAEQGDSAQSLHADELCLFSALGSENAVASVQHYIDFYLAHSKDLNLQVHAFPNTRRHYVLPVKTGPPVVLV